MTYHDLNVCIEDRETALATLSRFGYDTVAFNRTVNAKRLTDEHLPRTGSRSQKRDQATPGVLRVRDVLHKGSVNRRSSRGVRVLERITLIIDDASKLTILGSPILRSYDIVAVQPSSEKLLQQCLQSEFEIVSLPLGSRLSFYIKRPQVNVAKEKGIMFEIPYAMALRDSGQRRNLVGNAASLVRATAGKQVITSSAAVTAMELRGPHDIINLGLLFNLSQEQARLSVCRLAGDTVTHGRIRARTHKGIVGMSSDLPGDEDDEGHDNMDSS